MVTIECPECGARVKLDAMINAHEASHMNNKCLNFSDHESGDKVEFKTITPR